MAKPATPPRPLPVWGYLAIIPRSWPTVPSPNGDPQRRVVVAAKTRTQAYRLISAALGGGVSHSAFNANASTTGNIHELAAAYARPGRVFYATKDLGDVYEVAPTEDI